MRFSSFTIITSISNIEALFLSAKQTNKQTRIAVVSSFQKVARQEKAFIGSIFLVVIIFKIVADKNGQFLQRRSKFQWIPFTKHNITQHNTKQSTVKHKHKYTHTTVEKYHFHFYCIHCNHPAYHTVQTHWQCHLCQYPLLKQGVKMV